jgi:hypothetical protein
MTVTTKFSKIDQNHILKVNLYGYKKIIYNKLQLGRLVYIKI